MTTPKKILICGYSHCGTTILKSIIAHIEDVEEIMDECDNVSVVNDANAALTHVEQLFYDERLGSGNAATAAAASASSAVASSGGGAKGEVDLLVRRRCFVSEKRLAGSVYNVRQSTNKKYILCKCSQAQSKFFDIEYKDYIKIFIIRNPLFVFSSINKRYAHYKLSKYHSIQNYIDIVKMFIKYKNNPEKNIYTIKYEDLFPNNYEELKKILNDIGFQYDDGIFDNSKYTNLFDSNVKVVKDKPSNQKHHLYRNWQINQPFISNNHKSKIDLSDSQKEKLINNSYVLQLYPDINSAF